jgi:hypothetical protein
MKKHASHEYGEYRNPFDTSERNTVGNDVSVPHRAHGVHYHNEEKNFSQNYPSAAIPKSKAPQRISGGNAAPLAAQHSHGWKNQTRDGHLRDAANRSGHRIGKR